MIVSGCVEHCGGGLVLVSCLSGNWFSEEAFIFGVHGFFVELRVPLVSILARCLSKMVSRRRNCGSGNGWRPPFVPFVKFS